MIGYASGRGSIALYAERRPFLHKVRPGVAGAFPLGMAFAAGWTPCIGPVLGGIFFIASTQSTARGVLLLVVYSLGLGVPFLLIGLGIQWLSGTLQWFRRNYRVITVASGSLLVGMGIMLITGTFTRFLIALFLRAGFFDVFGSWWFVLILTLLFVSLIACLIPRSRAMIRTIRQRPIQAREIDAFPQYRELHVPADPTAVAATARTVLRRHGYRVALATDGRAVAAEKGALRGVGSLVFHWAFLVLLVAVIVGKGTGYVGHATIVEGQTWTDAAFNYDGDLRTGRFSSGSHTGIGITLIDYSDAFRQSGVPMDFTSKVELFNPDGSLARTDSVTINHPVSFDGARIFQFGFGWAPVLTISDGGSTIFHGPVVMGQNAQPGDNPLTVPWIGFVKLPTLRPQVAIKLELYPDSVAYFAGLIAGVPQPMTQAADPFMRYSLWKGKLLDPSLSGLDTRFMHQVATGGIGQGWTVDLARGCVASGTSTAGLPRQLAGTVCPSGGGSGLTMSFPQLRQYSRLQ